MLKNFIPLEKFFMKEREYNKEKAKIALFVFLSAAREIHPVKAHLLFYFLDFDCYEAYEFPFTGETYTATPDGPHAQHLESLVHEMQRDGLLLTTNNTYIRAGTVEQREVTGTAFLKSLTDKEDHILMHTLISYCSRSTEELQRIATSQVPFNAVSIGEEIPYEFTFYRDSPSLAALREKEQENVD
jgi:hypothetical protein